MRSLQTSDTPSETTRNQFRTPRRPSPLGSAGRPASLKSTTSKRTQSPDSTNSRKRSSLPSSRAQPTLTQIDFVTQTTELDDDRLAYIDRPGPRDDTPRTNEFLHIDDGSNEDADGRPPSTRTRSTHISKSRTNDRDRSLSEHPTRRRGSFRMSARDTERNYGLRKTETPRGSLGAKNNRKSMEKSAGKRDKTLTQMHFVRRYITIDDDDDEVNMGYIQPMAQETEGQDGPGARLVETKKAQPELQQTSAKRSHKVFEEELDLSTGEPISESGDTQDASLGDSRRNKTASGPPVTPRKSRKLEIPSSQSPDSPGFAIITSSQFRSATRSPLKQRSSNLKHHPEKPVKEESPHAWPADEASQDEDDTLSKTSISDSPSGPDSLTLRPASSEEAAPLAPPPETISRGLSAEGKDELRDKHTRERTVVYETDAETDYADSEDDLDGHPVTPSQENVLCVDDAHATQSSPGPPKDDPQFLPLPAVQSTTDLDGAPPPEPSSSDASICYQRMHAATQFPHEPIPTLNTQKLSELFSHESGPRYTKPAPPRAPPHEKLGPFMQSQTQSQEGDNASSEIVPESSPVRGPEHSVDVADTTFQRPRAPDSVVQVESSQPVDWGSHRPGRILSRSQLLTSSVMESIPLPNFCTESQDSVGEPYSLPDR